MKFALSNVQGIADRIPKGPVVKGLAIAAGGGAALAGSAAAGYGIAHKMTDVGDYKENRKWQMAAVNAAFIAGGASVALGVAGALMSRHALAAPSAAMNDARIALFEARDIVRNNPGQSAKAVAAQDQAVERVAETADRFNAVVKRSKPLNNAALITMASGSLLVSGAAGAEMETSSRLDPGILEVKGSVDVNVKTESLVKQAQNSADDFWKGIFGQGGG